MPIPGADWRIEADYNYCDQLNPEQAAFEFLRRNPDYNAAYRKLADGYAGDPPPTPAPSAARWGLRFRGRPRNAQRSDTGHLVA